MENIFIRKKGNKDVESLHRIVPHQRNCETSVTILVEKVQSALQLMKYSKASNPDYTQS